MFPIKYMENNLVWHQDGEVSAYYELLPYNYSFLSAEQKFLVHDSFRQLIAQNRDGNIHALQITTERSVLLVLEQSKGCCHDLHISIMMHSQDAATHRNGSSESPVEGIMILLDRCVLLSWKGATVRK